MKALILEQVTSLLDNQRPLSLVNLPNPRAGRNDVVIRILVCGVCHTEIDEIEGRMPPRNLPMVLGHQVVGKITEIGNEVRGLKLGDRVGVAWIFSVCGKCDFCLNGQENLCPSFQATGRDAQGGYAEYISVPAAFVYAIPNIFTDCEAAPLLCAGAIGYRSLRLTQLRNGQKLGLTGFGASAHLVLKMARYKFPDSRVYVFARNPKERAFAMELGAAWAGDTLEQAPERVDAMIDTTPVWKPIVAALEQLKSGGRLVINAIRKENVDQSALLELNYPQHLWMEKEIKSVANVERRDVTEFLDLAARIPIRPAFQEYPLAEANRALVELKKGKIRGAKVLRIAY